MLYRIALKTQNGTIYYLTSDDDAPETDANVDFDNIQFLLKLNPAHAHTFSTEELAKKCCQSLPYPYNEKVSLMVTDTKESLPPVRIYYRIVQMAFGKLNYINHDKKFTKHIDQQTATFLDLDVAKEFFELLSKFTKKISCIAEVHDFGPPDYKFKNYFITSTEKKVEVFPL
jgi:hypothetical protein